VGDIRRFESEFLGHLRHSHKEILDAIQTTGKLEDDTVEALKTAIENFKRVFLAKDNHLKVNEAEAEAMAEGAEGQEKVTRYRPPAVKK
jgi:F-type H+-transporting ATPase subunit alpha